MPEQKLPATRALHKHALPTFFMGVRYAENQWIVMRICRKNVFREKYDKSDDLCHGQLRHILFKGVQVIC